MSLHVARRQTPGSIVLKNVSDVARPLVTPDTKGRVVVGNFAAVCHYIPTPSPDSPNLANASFTLKISRQCTDKPARSGGPRTRKFLTPLVASSKMLHTRIMLMLLCDQDALRAV